MSVRVPARLVAVAAALALPGAGPLAAQSLLDRPPNLSGDWVVPRGTVEFNFLHRFIASSAPERKVTSFPTFVLATGVIQRLAVGFHYATNSTLASNYPNEWEFWGRYALLSEDEGAPLDVAGQVGYNLAAKGVDGELSLARRVGPVRLLAAGRLLHNPFAGKSVRPALGGGAVLRLGRYFALTGDVSSIVGRDTLLGERTAWSAGVHVALPSTPHTLSLQATNTNTATLQGISRGGGPTRYGFEFTIPITLARFFGKHAPPPAPVAGPAPAVAPVDTTRPPRDTTAAAPPAVADTAHADTTRAEPMRADTTRVDTTAGRAVAPPHRAAPKAVTRTVHVKNLTFGGGRVEIPVGGTVVWRNDDPLAHTVTAADRSFDSGLIQPGASFRHTFTKPGTYAYSCTPHPFMKGTVVVR